MSRTAAGAALTLSHRQRQIALRAGTLRQILTLWPAWNGSRETFDAFVSAALVLIRQRHRDSSGLAAAYYQQFRKAEGVAGQVTPRLAVFTPEAVVTSLYVTGPVTMSRALRTGQTATQARATALVSVSGAVTRHVLDGGRTTIIETAKADPKAAGFSRVTSGRPCAFCAMLASRGPVYFSAESADFHPHDSCHCEPQPHFDGAEWPGRGREFQQTWKQAKTLARDEGIRPDVAFRRLVEGRA